MEELGALEEERGMLEEAVTVEVWQEEVKLIMGALEEAEKENQSTHMGGFVPGERELPTLQRIRG